MLFFKRFLSKWLKAPAAATLSLILVLPPSGSAQEVDIGDLMPAMETAFINLVRAVLVVPVQESLDEPNFDEVGKRAGEIVKIAQGLPSLKNYKNDSSFQDFARKLEKQGQRLAGFARKKQTDASVAALVRLQAACLQCHKNHRF